LRQGLWLIGGQGGGPVIGLVLLAANGSVKPPRRLNLDPGIAQRRIFAKCFFTAEIEGQESQGLEVPLASAVIAASGGLCRDDVRVRGK
jgi:hypothetical protein